MWKCWVLKLLMISSHCNWSICLSHQHLVRISQLTGVERTKIASTKEELEKLNSESRHFQSLSDIRARLCYNCHCSGHTKVKCSKPPCTDISVCKIIEKHPGHKMTISQLQHEIRSLENKAQEEEAHFKGLWPHVCMQNLRFSLLWDLDWKHKTK